MSKNLVIVESPAKAKTIENYLGKEYKVSSSFGHVRDLQKGNNAIDVENGFEPTYVVSPDKTKVIKELKKLAKDAETIYLASDDDREGEAISWHLKEVLQLDNAKTKRIVFREITKGAIQKAIENPRDIDIDLVNAQQARRILDRLVGFELSPILWKKIKTGLSAGRVQSVAVRLVVEKERSIDEFVPKTSFRVTALFKLDGGKELAADLPKKFATEEEVNAFLENCIGSDFSIKDLQKKPAKKSPAPPFTTSTLQQEASRKLGYSVLQTMTLAQKLYEQGKISYMRTDSVNLSQTAIKSAADQIKSAYGDEFFEERHFKTKSKGAQEAHEAIRPTNFSEKVASDDNGQQRLYDLIWKRAIASQMADAQLEKTTVTIDVSGAEENFIAKGEVITFEGFLKVYIASTDDENEDEDSKGMLPPLAIGEVLDLDHIKSRQVFTRHPARFTEASLVKQLEEMGIGRPSTYAPTITTIQKRGYVLKESREGRERKYRQLILESGKISATDQMENTGAENKKLFPTNIAMVVNDFLVKHFTDVTDYSFTANIEKKFDDIAEGKDEWNHMIGSFYKKFHPKVEKTETLDRSEVGSVKLIGIDPKSGKNIYAKLGKYGPYAQIGENDDAEKPKYAGLRNHQLIEKLTLEEALELFKLPREVGEFEDKVMIAAIGRFGPYIRHDGKFCSIPKELDPHTITKEEAIELVKAKQKADAEKFIKSFDENPDIQVLNGRYGPYIKAGKKNVKIPKDKEPSELTLEECLTLAAAAPAKKGRARKKK